MTRPSVTSASALAGAVFLVVVTGCSDGAGELPAPGPDDIAPAPTPAPEVLPTEDAPALSDEQLAFATFFIDDLGGAPIRLRNGEWADESNVRAVTLTPAPRFRGDLDGDGDEEVAAVLVAGSTIGFDTYLVAVGAGNGRATQEAILDLGPGATVRGMRVEGRELVLEILRVPRPGQPPRPPEDERYLLERGQWTRVGS